MEKGRGDVDCNLSEVEDSFIPCQRFDCRHHFSWGMSFDKRGGRHPVDFTETEESRKSLNCMCLLREPMSQPEIAKIFGVSAMEISLIEAQAIEKIKHKLGR